MQLTRSVPNQGGVVVGIRVGGNGLGLPGLSGVGMPCSSRFWVSRSHWCLGVGTQGGSPGIGRLGRGSWDMGESA